MSQVLAQKVEKQFLKADRKEALLQILGQDFADKYLPTAKRNPWVLVCMSYFSFLFVMCFTAVCLTFCEQLVHV